MTICCDLPPQLLGKDMRRQPKRLSDLQELISAALRAAHVARDKGFYTVSREATRCVDILRRIKSLPLKARVISASNAFCSLEFLAKNGNPKIRCEARSVLQHWRNILSGNHRDHVAGSSCSTREDGLKKKIPLTKASIRRTERSEGLKPSKALTDIDDSVGSCLSREHGTKKKASPSVNSQRKTSPSEDTHEKMSIRIQVTESVEPSEAMENNGESVNSCANPQAHTQKETSSLVGSTELLEVYETVKKAHKAVKDQTLLSAENSRRCVVALKGLFLVPRAVTRDLLLTTDAGLRMLSLSKHSDPNVQSMAESLFDHWRMLIYSRN